MTRNSSHSNNKELELKKYRDLVLAILDYYLENTKGHITTSEFNSVDYYNDLKVQTEDNFNKGRLNRLKQWFRDLTEMRVEERNIKFNQYLMDKTKYEIDIFKSYFERIDKIIARGKITSDNQFYDINNLVAQLCQAEPLDNERIKLLNRLLSDYETRKMKNK